MPFVARYTETPPLAVLLELEQIVLIDKTGPTIPFGVAAGASCLVGEFLKGPFNPTEVTSQGELLSLFGGVSNSLSQDAAGVQGGSAAGDTASVRYEGNGPVALIAKRFRRLIIQRVDADMTATDGGATKAFVKFNVLIGAADTDGTKTARDLVVPGGTRLSDAAIATATKVVGLSQDVLIPKGTAITAGAITISSVASTGPNVFNVLQDASTGLLTVQIDSAGAPKLAVPNSTGVTAQFFKGTTVAIAELDTAIDRAILGAADAATLVDTAGISTVNASAAASATFAAGTAAASLAVKYESRYSAAIDKTRPTGAPQEDITTIWAARRGETASPIRNALQQNATDASVEGRGRIALVSGPRVGSATGDAASATAAKTEVQGTTPTEGLGRSDRKIVCFPYVEVFSSDLGKNVEVAPDGFMATTLSQFPEEKNPGARNPHIQLIQNVESEFVASPLSRGDYVNFKAKGVAALRRDRSVGWWFQSGVTSVDPVVDPTRAPIKRRRMADMIQDTLAALGAKYNKEPATTERVDLLAGEVDSFLSLLKSANQPALQRIEDFQVDTVSGNTPKLTALGIFTIIVKVRLLASMDTLVFQTTIGETVEIEAEAA